MPRDRARRKGGVGATFDRLTLCQLAAVSGRIRRPLVTFANNLTQRYPTKYIELHLTSKLFYTKILKTATLCIQSTSTVFIIKKQNNLYLLSYERVMTIFGF